MLQERGIKRPGPSKIIGFGWAEPRGRKSGALSEELLGFSMELGMFYGVDFCFCGKDIGGKKGILCCAVGFPEEG
jgi:hypothetical protein